MAYSMPRQWSVNGRFLGRNPTGVDRYALEILRAMDALITEGHPLAQGITLDVLCPTGTKNVSPFVNIPLRVLPSASGHLWEQLMLPRHVPGGLLSLCNAGPLAVKKQIVCIHDTNIRLSPESYGLLFRTVYRFLQPALGRRVAQIATVSRFSQETIARFGIRPANEIAVIHDGYEHVLEWKADRSALAQLDLPHPFVLMVGSKAPHKNVAIIYSIAADLAAIGIHVLVVGGEDAHVYARERIISQMLSSVRHLGRVSDDDLAFLYQNALCLMFPSQTEGFGLPVLEAMALGCPVISSDVASLREVCGEAALYAPPDSGAAWLAAINQIATETTVRERLASAGPKRAKMFSWRQSAEKYLELMVALDDRECEKGRRK
jgi:glycosyltransferase involved in cell wall biosynthesis